VSKTEDEKARKLDQEKTWRRPEAKPKARKRYDRRCRGQFRTDDIERRDFFSEMKKREF